MERYDDAIKAYRESIEVEPGYLRAWNNMGDAHEAKKEWKEALVCYEQVLGLDPKNEIANARKTALATRVSRVGEKTL
jgi:tetratricopeptide (TPR) repeat protein